MGPGYEMRPEYDFAEGIRGKYIARLLRGTKVVVLDPDIARAFKTAEAVNGALRLQTGKAPKRKPPRGARSKSRSVRGR